MSTAALAAAKLAGRKWLESVWEEKAPKRATHFTRRVCRSLLDLLLEAKIERLQESAHIPRDPQPPDPATGETVVSLEEILTDRLGTRVPGKTAHRALRLLEQLGIVGLFFEHPLADHPVDGKRRKKAPIAFSRRRVEAGLSPWYHPCLHFEATTALLDALESISVVGRRWAQLAELALAQEVARARDRRAGRTGPATSPAAIATILGSALNTGHERPEQLTGQAYKNDRSVRTRGSPPSSSDDGAATPLAAPSPKSASKRGGVDWSSVDELLRRLNDTDS